MSNSVNSDKNKLSESIKKEEELPIRLIITIACSIIAVGLILLLFSMLPDPDNVIYINPGTSYDNFFFKALFDYYEAGGYWWFDYLIPNYGFLTFTPIIMILLFISGSTVLLKKIKEIKIAIFVNWALYIILIVASHVFEEVFYYGWRTTEFVFLFGYYPLLLNVTLQLSILINKSTFIEWFGFGSKRNKSNDSINKVLGFISSVSWAIIYFYIWILPFSGIYIYILGRTWWSALDPLWLSIPAYILWFIFVEAILRSIIKGRSKKIVKVYQDEDGAIYMHKEEEPVIIKEKKIEKFVFCTNCGAENSAFVEICSSCNKPLIKKEEWFEEN